MLTQIKFEYTCIEWIPDYLSRETQAALRVEMAKPASSSEEDGYIYAFELKSM